MPYVLFLEILEFPCRWTLFLVDFKIFKLPNVWLLTFIAFGFRIEGIILEEISWQIQSRVLVEKLTLLSISLNWHGLFWFWKSHPTISCTRCVMLCEFPILCLVVLTILKLLPTHLSSICLLSFRFQSSNIPTQWQPRQGCWLFPASSWCWWYAALYHWWLFVSFKCLYCWHTMCFNFRGDRFLFYGCQYLTSLQEVKKPMAG